MIQLFKNALIFDLCTMVDFLNNFREIPRYQIKLLFRSYQYHLYLDKINIFQDFKELILEIT